MIDEVLSFLDSNGERALADLKKIAGIPSIAAKNEGIEECSEMVLGMLEDINLEAALHATSGSPVVTGLYDAGASRTLMFYNHYDVQPAEPLELWKSPPFEPDERDGRIYGRGVADNKGDLVTRIWAIKAFLETGKKIPVNVKFVVEGEEEIGSVNLQDFTSKNEEFLKADGGIWEFGGSDYDGVQQAWLGLKGIFYVQLEVEKLSRNVHSSMGGILPSAPQKLVDALNSLKGPDNQILIDGFYDGIQPLSEAEWEAIDKIDLHEEDMKEEYGISQFQNGLTGRNLKEAVYGAPSSSICGLTSGYQGEGSMTVLPGNASAKVDFRLVENMNPLDVREKLRKHLDAHGFTDVKIAWSEGYAAAKTPIDHPFVDVVRRANDKVFGDLRVHPTSSGSGPLYLFKDHVPMVSVGVGDVESRSHSPNESIKLENFFKGMDRIALIVDEMGRW
ncbi:MAG: M20/M25/M40 family metallo-hydrolase [Candidatus Thorarchaeota archaeon]|nr:MAG: M20/M25/M40 family metallo-hydrolase [Candidatus Thorarchaeota archaeon]